MSGLQLTPRDLDVLRHVARHRFLSSRQIIALVGGSVQHMLKRLQRLYHHGYLDRPRAQVRYFAETGSQPLVYALGSAGARALSDPQQKRPRYDNRNVKQLYLQHTLLVADVMLAFEKACSAAGAPELLLEENIAPGQSPSVAFKWTVTVRHGKESKRVGVFPDRAFILRSRSTGERVLFFVEADRSTMPVTRRSLTQTSLLRKLLAYEATWAQGIAQQRFGCSRFRVLIVTTGSERAQHAAETCSELGRGHGLFLFTDIDAFRTQVSPDAGGVLGIPWLNARGRFETIDFP